MKTSSFLFSILLLLAVAAQAQTTRTWVGTTNDWGTASNWSPSGVPSSSDKVKITGTGLAPVLGANRTVARLYVDSDSLAMGGYTLTVSGTVTMSSGTVTGSGKIDQVAGSSDSTRYVSSQLNCKVVGKSGRIIATSSVFADSTRFARHLGTVKSECGGNVFHGHVEIENSDSKAFYFGVALPDTFWSPITVRNFSDGRLGLCHSSTGNYIAGGWLLNLSTDANSSITLFNSSTTFSTATLSGPLHLGASGGLEIKTVGSGGQLILTASGTLKIDTMGFAAGTLILGNVQQENTTATSFTGMAAGSEVRIYGGSTFLGKITGTGFRKFNVDGSRLLGGVDVHAEQTVLNDSRFEGNVSLTRTSAAAPVNLFLGGNYFGDDFTFRHASGAAETHWGHSAPDTVMGNLSIANESTNRAMFGRAYHSLVQGNVTLQADSGRIYMGDNTGSVILCGSGNQAWTSNTTDYALEYVKHININKPAGRVILTGIMEVRKTLALTSGIVEAKDDSYVKLRDGATLTGVSNASFVEGAVVAQGDTAFTFPIGANGRYRPLSISAPALATAEFKATYYNVNSDEFYTHSQKDSTIGDISRNEVWLLERLTTSNTVNVTLSWDTAASCAFDTLANLKVVGRDTTSAGIWKDLGNGGTTGNVNAGTVVTASAAAGYWAFGLGTSDAYRCAPGASCDEAIDLATGDSCVSDISLQLQTTWFKFMADSANVKLTFDNMTAFELDTALVYTECGIDTLLPLEATCYLMGNKLIVMVYGLEPAHEHYLKLIGKTNAGSGGDMCKMPYYHRDGNACEIVVPDIPAPEVDWRSITWAPVRPDTEFPQTQLASNEDWWYHHINSYDGNGKLNGFLGVGYSGFDNYRINETTLDGCYDGLSSSNPQENIHATAGLVSPNGGEMKWFDTFAEGDFYSAIQTQDGGYIAVGRTYSTRTKNGNPLYYNPTSTPTDYFSNAAGHCSLTGTANDPEESQRHGYLVKMDAMGNPEWEYIYGMLDFDSGNGPQDAYHAESQLYDIVEMGDGNFRVVGFSRTEYNMARQLFLLDIDANGRVQQKFVDDGIWNQGMYGYGVKKLQSGDYAVVGKMNRLVNDDDLACYPAYEGSSYYEGANLSYVACFATYPNYLPSNTEGSDIRLFFPDDDVSSPLKTVIYDMELNADGKIIVPVVDVCDDCCNGRGAGRAVVHQLNTDGSADRPPLDLGLVKAFDLKIGVTATADGGYAIVSTRQESSGPIPGYGDYSNSDAFVAKVDAQNLLQWEATFDEGDTPDDVCNPKKQECLYSITEAPDGGLVVAGNNSYGADCEDNGGYIGDDNYMVKLKSDCASRQAYKATSTVINIIDDTVWDAPQKIGSKVRVQSGQTLTITGATTVIEFASSASIGHEVNITVEPGGRLIVENGATLTSLTCCNETWDGVIVQGTPTVGASLAVGGPQGQMLLRSGGKVVNAKVGVRAETGGIVRTSTNGGARPSFVNCRKAVELPPYSFSTSSQFFNTDFICDAPMVHYSYNWNGQPIGVNAFVSAYLHSGTVRFMDCAFTNTLTATADAMHPQVRGLGIVAIDTKVKVNDSEFTGLFRAVDVKRTTYSPTLLGLHGNTFDNNMQGLLSEGSNDDLITGNIFKVPDIYNGNPTSGTDPLVYAWGASMRTGSYFEVKENDFMDLGAGLTESIGLDVRGYSVPLAAGGLVYHNDFSNTVIGTQTELNNALLQMRCNNYDDVLAPWVINWESPDGILGPQGTGCEPFNPAHYRAGNHFNNNPLYGIDNHIWSKAQPFDYYYANDASDEQPNYDDSPNIVVGWNCGLTTDNSCPSTNPPNPCVGNPAPCIVSYDEDIDLLELEKANLIADLDSNGTKTSLMLARLADTTYSNSALTANLLQWSLLSDTVLKAACLRHPFFNEDQILNIALGNSPVTQAVWPYIVGTFDFMKEEYADSIKAAQSTTSIRTVRAIEREKERLESTRHYVVMQHLQSFIDEDGTPDSTYAMIHWLTDSIVGKQWKQLAVGTALSLDTLTWASTLLTSIDVDNAEDSAFFALHNLAISLREDTLTWLDMDSTQRAQISALADGETMMKPHAEAVLALLADTFITRVPEHFEIPSYKRVEEETQPEPITTRRREHVDVFPNPFSNSFSLRYALADEADKVRVEIFDLVGRSVKTVELRKTQSGQITVELNECLGIYILRMTADNKQVHQQKLVCLNR